MLGLFFSSVCAIDLKFENDHNLVIILLEGITMLINDLNHVSVTTQNILGGRSASASAFAFAFALGNRLTTTTTVTTVVVSAGSFSG